MTASDFSVDYLALRAANDIMRERGKTWVYEALNGLCLEISPELQLGRQDWQFEVGRSVMVGERYGVRYRGQTLIVEIGWPREPAHGFVPDQGLARGRISLSLSPMLSARSVDELILRKIEDGPARWYTIHNGRPGPELSADNLRGHLKAMLEP